MNVVEQALARDGFVVLRGIPSPSAFERTLAELGNVVLRTAVELRSDVPTYLCRPAPVPFHTDHPDVDLVGWWCERQDDEDGACLLVDAAAVVATLDASARESLAEVCLPCPELCATTSDGSLGTRTVISPTGEVYFAAWLTPTADVGGVAWRELVRGVNTARPREIFLMPGDGLVVDNHRMAHGRRALGARSRRRLLRAWVTRDDASQRGR